MKDVLVIALLASVIAVAAADVQVTFVVSFGKAPGSNGGDIKRQKAQFANAFQLGFADAVANAACLAIAPHVNQRITYTPSTGIPQTASIAFTYPADPAIDPELSNGVAHVIANPAEWFSTIDATKIYSQRLTYFIGPPGGFISGVSDPVLTPFGPGGNCSPPPVAASPPPSTVSPPPFVAPSPSCAASNISLTLMCQSTITLGRATTRQLQLDVPETIFTALFVAGATGVSAEDIMDPTRLFDDSTLVFTSSFTAALCDKDLPALVAVEEDATYFILKSTQVGTDFATLGSFTTCMLMKDSEVSPPTPPTPPSAFPPPPNPPLPSRFPSPPPPFACAPNSAITSIIQMNGDYATVIAALGTFQNELAAALASLWCTCFSAITVGTPLPLIQSSYTFFVPVKISYNSMVSFATNPATCGVVSYTGLIDAFSSGANAPVTCFQRIASQDANFAPQWAITAGTCNEAMVLSPPPPPPPPFSTPFSPPPSPPLPPYSPPNPLPLYSPPRPPPAPPAVRRRLIDSTEVSSVMDFTKIEPTDVAYGSDKVLYELFTVKSNFFEAGAICLSRGATLATYTAEESQVFVDILCDASADMTCWVNGAKNGRCAAVDKARMQFVACDKRQHFVCMTQGAANV